MTAIPNTIRRGAIYWYRCSRSLPSGNRFRATVSLRTACRRAGRRRAAVLTVKAYSFGDSRTAREQRQPFPVALARKMFRLPPWPVQPIGLDRCRDRAPRLLHN